MQHSSPTRLEQSDFERFLDAIDHPLLDPVEVVALGRRIVAGKAAAAALAQGGSDDGRPRLEALVEDGEVAVGVLVDHHLRFLRKEARHWSDSPSFEDVFQEGWLALRSAAQLFDPALGEQFIAYAQPFVRAAFSLAAQRLDEVVRRPARLRKHIKRFESVWGRLAAALERAPSVHEVAVETGWTMAMTEAVATAADLGVGWRAPLGPTVLITSDHAGSVAEAVANAAEIPGLLDTLNERQRWVVVLRFGFDGSAPRSLAQVAEIMGVTKARVHQIERAALDRMQEVLETWGKV